MIFHVCIWTDMNESLCIFIAWINQKIGLQSNVNKNTMPIKMTIKGKTTTMTVTTTMPTTK